MEPLDVLLFNDLTDIRGWTRSLGAHRIRTQLEYHGYRSEVVDCSSQFSLSQIKTLIDQRCDRDKTTIIGWSSTFFLTGSQNGSQDGIFDFSSYREKNDIISYIRKNYPTVWIVIGGPLAYEINSPQVDVCLYGYADNAIIQLLHDIETQPDSLGRFRDSNTGALLIDADQYAPKTDVQGLVVKWEPHDQIDRHEFLPIEISRGCIFQCAFCQFPLIGKRKMDYLKSPQELDWEFRRNHDLFGTTGYLFMDDTYNDTLDKLRMVHDVVEKLPFEIEFCTYLRLDIIHRFPEMMDIMSNTGLKTGFLGIETFHPTAGKRIGKGLDVDKQKRTLEWIKQNYPHIRLFGGFIFGVPDEPISGPFETHRWLKQNPVLEGWRFEPMQVQTKRNPKYYSKIDRDPESYGYQVDLQAGGWKNAYMSRNTAISMSRFLNDDAKPDTRISSWSYAYISSLGEEAYQYLDQYQKDINWSHLDRLQETRVENYKRSKLNP